MTTFEALFCWALLFLGLKVHNFNDSHVRLYMTLGAILICLFVSISQGKTNGFQQRQSSFSSHFCDSRSGYFFHGC
jgi:hypothetical protein